MRIKIKGIVQFFPFVSAIDQLLRTQIGDDDSYSGGYSDYNDDKYKAVNIWCW